MMTIITIVINGHLVRSPFQVVAGVELVGDGGLHERPDHRRTKLWPKANDTGEYVF